jgi:hypothetical protein
LCLSLSFSLSVYLSIRKFPLQPFRANLWEMPLKNCPFLVCFAFLFSPLFAKTFFIEKISAIDYCARAVEKC